MSEADKIIENLKKSGRKVEEFYTGNKTSDKNVANIEEDVKILENFCEFEDAVVLTDYALTLVQETIKHILAELEQKDKKIKELEEESKILEFQNKQVENYAEELKKYNKTVSDRIVEYKKNSIPKQVVIDELKKLSDMLNKTTEGRIQKYTVNEIIIRSNALQELLEGERK